MLLIRKYLTRKPKILIPMVLQHSKDYKDSICQGPVCSSSGITGGGPVDGRAEKGLRRAKASGKCRMGFIPEEWFLFLKPMTGVSGPYLLMMGLGNYLASKEILVMEHEYYLGLSVFLVLYFVTTRLGPTIGASLDKEVDALANELEEGRRKELAVMQKHIDDAKIAIWRAEGQKELIDAKKENIAIQLEAVYRERVMVVHKAVLRRMEYHVKRHYINKRLKHKWMVQWILENVHKGITPEFKRHVMEIAIRDLTALADKYEASTKK